LEPALEAGGVVLDVVTGEVEPASTDITAAGDTDRWLELLSDMFPTLNCRTGPKLQGLMSLGLYQTGAYFVGLNLAKLSANFGQQSVGCSRMWQLWPF